MRAVSQFLLESQSSVAQLALARTKAVYEIAAALEAALAEIGRSTPTGHAMVMAIAASHSLVGLMGPLPVEVDIVARSIEEAPKADTMERLCALLHKVLKERTAGGYVPTALAREIERELADHSLVRLMGPLTAQGGGK